MKLSFSAHPFSGLMMAGVFALAPARTALASLLALALHEGAHLLVMLLCGVRRCAIEVTPFGGIADAADFHRLHPWKRAAIACAGVLGSAGCAVLCAWLGPETGFWYAFGKANAVFALLNCLPVWPLDGARVLTALAGCLGVERGAARIMLGLSYALSMVMVALALYGAWLGHVNLSLLVMGPYLAYAAHESAVGSRIRGFERVAGLQAEHWADKTKTVQAFACRGHPTPLQLTRLLKRATGRGACLLHVLDADTGAYQKTLSEADMAGILFDDSFQEGKE